MNGQRYDQVRRIWMERAPTWRRAPLPATSETALRKKGALKSETINPPKQGDH